MKKMTHTQIYRKAEGAYYLSIVATVIVGAGILASIIYSFF
jgi:hypothetical protein